MRNCFLAEVKICNDIHMSGKISKNLIELPSIEMIDGYDKSPCNIAFSSNSNYQSEMDCSLPSISSSILRYYIF